MCRCLATKYSALLLVPLFAVLLLVAVLRSAGAGETTARDALVATLGALCCAVAAVWNIYLGIDPSLSYVRPPASSSGVQQAVLELLPLPGP